MEERVRTDRPDLTNEGSYTGSGTQLDLPGFATVFDMMSEAESRLFQRGLSIEEFDLQRHDDPDVCGYVVLRPTEGSATISAMIRPGLPVERRAGFAEWLEVRIDRYFEHGPEPDGWQRRKTDGDWQLWAREVQLPSLDD